MPVPTLPAVMVGYALAGYGCTTCIGNAGDLTPEINETITANDLVCAAVLSGNRNFEARIHPNLKANFLASPPLVVAYAIAGTVRRDLMSEPVGTGKGGKPVWPWRADLVSRRGDNGLRTIVNMQFVGLTRYFDAAGFPVDESTGYRFELTMTTTTARTPRYSRCCRLTAQRSSSDAVMLTSVQLHERAG